MHSNPFTSQTASYDVRAISATLIAHHVIATHSNPRVLGRISSYDAASSICQSQIGGMPKSEIREIATAAGLPNAARKDSQGICFLGKVKFSEFVAEHLVGTDKLLSIL